MIRRPPRSTRTDTLFPYTTLFRSGLPQVSVFHWFAISRTPAIFLPAENPLRYTILHIIAVGRHNDMAGAGEGAQSLDSRHQFHAVVGGIAFADGQFLFMLDITDDSSPTAPARIALPGPIGRSEATNSEPHELMRLQ